MKAILALLAVTLAISAAAPISEQQYQFLFTRFVEQYAKQYEVNAFFTKFNVFRANLDNVLTHNKKNLSYTLALNEFGDLSPQEFKAKFLKLKPKNNAFIRSLNHPAPVSNFAAPSSVDWRTKNAVTPVKNQGQCGSCWAFSATGGMEGANAIKTGKLLSLSEQQLVDCAGSTGNEGCNGGLMDQAFEWVIQNGGICSEADYPYAGVDQTCQKTCKPVAKFSGYKDVPANDETSLLTMVTSTPVSVAIEADTSLFQFYSSGVLDGDCGTQLDHGVLAAGFGTDSSAGKDYWLVKNSWGTGWGESGYVRIVRGKNMCGIAAAASSPTV